MQQQQQPSSNYTTTSRFRTSREPDLQHANFMFVGVNAGLNPAFDFTVPPLIPHPLFPFHGPAKAALANLMLWGLTRDVTEIKVTPRCLRTSAHREAGRDAARAPVARKRQPHRRERHADRARWSTSCSVAIWRLPLTALTLNATTLRPLSRPAWTHRRPRGARLCT